MPLLRQGNYTPPSLVILIIIAYNQPIVTSAVPTTAPTRPRRTMSEDSSSQDIRVARTASSRTKSHGAVAKPKEKPSVHADVIDQMDITGLGVGSKSHNYIDPYPRQTVH